MTKISDLTAATALTDADELVVNDGGVSKKITVANAGGYFGYTPKAALNPMVDTNASGFYSVPGWVTVSNGTNPSAASPWVSYVPMIVDRPITITEHNVYFTTTGGVSENYFMAICDMDTDGQPHATGIVQSLTVAHPASVGAVTTTGLSWAIPAGPYLIAHTTSSNFTARGFVGIVPGIHTTTVAAHTTFRGNYRSNSGGGSALSDPLPDYDRVHASSTIGLASASTFRWTVD